MAEIVTIEGQEFKQRNIWAVWIGLPLITLGIYSFVWYFKINDEARRYLRDESIRPGISVLAVTLGALVIVPAFVSIWNTANRIQRMQQNAGVERQIEPVIGLIGLFVLSLWTLYYQSNLNKIWDLYLHGRAPAPSPGTALTPPSVPPPPPQ
jgi:hypothetical protein